MVYSILALVLAMFLDPIRWVAAIIIVAVIRASDHAFEMPFVRMIYAAIGVSVVVEVALQIIQEARGFNVLSSAISLAVSLLVVWLINRALTWWWFRKAKSN